MAMCFQRFSNYKEANDCLEESLEIDGQDLLTNILKFANIVFNKGKGKKDFKKAKA